MCGFTTAAFTPSPLCAVLPRPAPVNPKGMFKENLSSPSCPSARRGAPSRRQHFCVPSAPKMFPINREGLTEGGGEGRRKGKRWFLAYYYSERDHADSLGEIQSSQRKFHLSLIYFGLFGSFRKNDPLSCIKLFRPFLIVIRLIVANSRLPESIRSRKENQPSAVDSIDNGAFTLTANIARRHEASERRVFFCRTPVCTSVPRCGHTYK